MAGRRKSVGPINYHELPRRKLQALCKKYGFPANKTNVAMADALTVLLNAPDRLAGRIDSPAVSSKSSYLSSSCEVEESPMISPGVDSLPTISETKAELFGDLRITKLPEIMEVEASPEKEVAVNKTEERGGICETDEMHTSEVIDVMTDNSVAPGSPPTDSNSKDQETEALRTAWMQDEAFGFKCLNPAALSPKVRRSLGIDIPKLPVSRLTVSARPKSRAFSENEIENEFSFDVQMISPALSPAPLASTEVADCGVALDTERNSISLHLEETSTVDAETACLSHEEMSETTQLVSAATVLEDGEMCLSTVLEDRERCLTTVLEDRERSESCSPIPGYVKEIVNLLEEKSGESAGVGRKDGYKQSPLMRSSRIAADIERASKLGQAKRAAVLAGKRSMSQSGTNSFGSLLETEIPMEEDEALQTNSPCSPVRDGLADSTEYHDADVDQVSPDLCLHMTCDTTLVNTPESPQQDQMEAEDIQPDSVVPPPLTGELTDGSVPAYNSSPTGVTEPMLAASGMEEADQKSSAEDVVNGKFSSDLVESPQQHQMEAEDTQPDSVVPPTQTGEHTDGSVTANNSSPSEVRDSMLAASGMEETYQKFSAENAVNGQFSSDPVESPRQDQMEAGDTQPDSVVPPTQTGQFTDGSVTANNSSPTEVPEPLLAASEMEETDHKSSSEDVANGELVSDLVESLQQDQMKAGDTQPDSVVPPTHTGELKDGIVTANNSSETEETESMSTASEMEETDQKSSAEDLVNGEFSSPLSNTPTDAGPPEIKYVEIPRPVETSAGFGSISELSWIRKATNLPTPKAQKPNEKIKRPVSSNLRKLGLMERAALNAAKKHRTPKKSANAKDETPDASATKVLASSKTQAPSENAVDVEMEDPGPASAAWSLRKTPDKATGPLSLRDCNKEIGVVAVDSCPASPKSPAAAISLDDILRENTLSTEKENLLRGKENERLRRHQEEYKTPLTGRSKEKALRAAEMNAASLREKILKQRRGIEEQDPSSGNSASAAPNQLVGRFL